MKKNFYVAPSVRIITAAVEDGFGASIRPDNSNFPVGTTDLGSGSWD